MSLKSYKAKRAIANSLYDEITRRGGRFLSLVDTGEEIKNIVEEGEWEEVSKKAGLEKGAFFSLRKDFRDSALCSPFVNNS
jgi:hypothetical protein